MIYYKGKPRIGKKTVGRNVIKLFTAIATHSFSSDVRSQHNIFYGACHLLWLLHAPTRKIVTKDTFSHIGRSGTIFRARTNVGRGSIAVRTLGSQSREPGFEASCCCFETLAISFIPHRHSSFSCINEYLATNKGGYLNE